MKLFLALLAVIIGIIVAPFFLSPSPDNSSGQAITGLPWQIETLPDGNSRVLGLTLGVSTLEDARTRFGDAELALVAAPNEMPSLELYINNATLSGALFGKMIVTADLSEETIIAMRQRAVKTEYMKSSTRRSTLADADIVVAHAAMIRGLVFVPQVNLDEALIVERFGQPTERIKAGENIEHLLYPDKGLDIVLDAKGKEVIQYVAPKNFASLREPLVKPVAPAQPDTSSAGGVDSPLSASGGSGTGSAGSQ